MLQKYKEDKKLQKLKEQRERAKRGVFKVGLFTPDVPAFLSSGPCVRKAEPKKVNANRMQLSCSAPTCKCEVTSSIPGTLPPKNPKR